MVSFEELVAPALGCFEIRISAELLGSELDQGVFWESLLNIEILINPLKEFLLHFGVVQLPAGSFLPLNAFGHPSFDVLLGNLINLGSNPDSLLIGKRDALHLLELVEDLVLSSDIVPLMTALFVNFGLPSIRQSEQGGEDILLMTLMATAKRPQNLLEKEGVLEHLLADLFEVILGLAILALDQGQLSLDIPH